MSRTFRFERFDVQALSRSPHLIEVIASSDGAWIKAQDALDREAVLQAQIRTLEVQLKEVRDVALEEAAVAAWSEGMDHYSTLATLWDPRHIGSKCASSIRGLKSAAAKTNQPTK